VWAFGGSKPTEKHQKKQKESRRSGWRAKTPWGTNQTIVRKDKADYETKG